MSAKKTMSFEEIWTLWYRKFVTIATRYVRDESLAGDLVSDAFVSYWECRAQFSDGDNVPAWIFTVVKNKCLNHLKTQKRHLEIMQDIHTHELRLTEANITALDSCDPHVLFSKEVREMVYDALEQMTPLMRQVFTASRMEDKTYEEISATLGIPTRRVTYEIQKALSILRKVFSDYLPALAIALTLYGE